jgi:hypothetical protein
MRGKKDPAAVSLGRKGGKASAKELTPEQRAEKAERLLCVRYVKVSVGENPLPMSGPALLPD